MTPERIAECKKICACVPFVEPGAGVDETQRAMRELIAQVEEDARFRAALAAWMARGGKTE